MAAAHWPARKIPPHRSSLQTTSTPHSRQGDTPVKPENDERLSRIRQFRAYAQLSLPQQSPNRWIVAYYKAVEYGRRKKADYLQLTGQFLEKEQKVDKANHVLRERNGQILKLQAQLTNLRLKVNNRDQTIHELENELRELKSTKKQSWQRQVNETTASSPTERRPYILTHVLHHSAAVRNHPSYEHPEAPRKNVKVDFSRFIPCLHYPTGTGKVGPGHYGSNVHWDLGLCQVHFRTPGVCKYKERCEYRDAPLDVNERQYIRFFEHKGPAFLASTDAILAAKHSAA
ncbi:hypothetical protein PtrM4_146220 [Pyrenophora tritici-repentis]|uniref:Uncharacterized protein n=1 Tax=Pyrenophora tritici-repentis TaxID=45151 RepID=A0A834VLK7_9PLEO|nr:hypothetical protein PtrM4_146220 [Pyrenophora tritici-repentis]